MELNQGWKEKLLSQVRKEVLQFPRISCHVLNFPTICVIRSQFQLPVIGGVKLDERENPLEELGKTMCQ